MIECGLTRGHPIDGKERRSFRRCWAHVKCGARVMNRGKGNGARHADAFGWRVVWDTEQASGGAKRGRSELLEIAKTLRLQLV